MQRGWGAEGLLQPLWTTYPGGRDGLAKAVGTHGSTLSSINSGKQNLGRSLGERLAAALGVSLLELGAPEGLANQGGLTLLDRLAELGTIVADLGAMVNDHELRLNALEARHASGEDEPRQRPARNGL